MILCASHSRRYAVWNDMFDAVPGLRFIEARLEDLKVINTFRWYVTPGVSCVCVQCHRPHRPLPLTARNALVRRAAEPARR